MSYAEGKMGGRGPRGEELSVITSTEPRCRTEENANWGWQIDRQQTAHHVVRVRLSSSELPLKQFSAIARHGKICARDRCWGCERTTRPRPREATAVRTPAKMIAACPTTSEAVCMTERHTEPPGGPRYWEWELLGQEGSAGPITVYSMWINPLFLL